MQFPRYSIISPHIQKVLKKYCEVNNRDIQSIELEVLEKIQKETLRLSKQSPIVFEETISLLVEEVVFEEYLVEEDLINKNMIFDLVKDIKIRHKQFMPLKDGYTHKKIWQVNIIFVPNNLLDLSKEVNEIKTAAISDKGDLYLNTNFINKLLTWAKYKKTNGSTLWYNNKEKDLYTYVEFIILHEYLHILNGDLYYIDHPNFDQKFNNLVCDFINNYELLKYFKNSEDYLLPIGLWSNKYNFDNFKTKSDIFNSILNELKENVNKKNFDEHLNHEANHEVNNEKKQPKQLEEYIEPNIVENSDDNYEIIEQNDNNKSTLSFEDLEYTPQYNWQTIINKMIPNDNNSINYSYSKISKRGISNIHRLYNEGISSIKPGIIKNKSNKNDLLLVLDNSGSILSALKNISYEFLELLKNKSHYINNIYLIKFDSKYSLYKLDLENNSFIEYIEPNYNKQLSFKSKQKKQDIKNILLSSFGGGTIFNKDLNNLIKGIIKNKKTNSIIFTDQDILNKKNKENFNDLIGFVNTQKFKLSILTPNQNDITSFKKSLKINKNIFLSNF